MRSANAAACKVIARADKPNALMQDALDHRTADYAEGDKSLNGKAGTALVIALRRNNSVPDRLKLSDDEFEIRMLRYSGIAMRQLLMDPYCGWRPLGATPKRGRVLPLCTWVRGGSCYSLR
jgi:hypothetical protein